MSFWDHEGSTRLVSVMRILTVAVVWSRFGAGMVPAFQTGPVDWLLCGAFWVVTPLAFLGVASRWTVGLTGLVCMGAYVSQGLLAGIPNMASHHVYALALLALLLAATPCGGSFSVDHWRSGAPERGPLWGQRLIALQASIIYLGAVYEKTSVAWFDGSRLAQMGQFIYLGSDHPGPVYDGLAMFAAIGTWGIELWLAVALWIPRWRLHTFVLGCGFHALVYIGTPVGTFSTTMLIFLLTVFDADTVHAWLDARSPVQVRKPYAWALLPLLVLPSVGLFGPEVRLFEGLAADACEVEFRDARGQILDVPEVGWSNGQPGLARAAAVVCATHGPLDVRGRCGLEGGGWGPVERTGWCPDQPALKGSGRRRVAQ